MHDEEDIEYELGDLSEEDLRKVKLFAEIHKLRLESNQIAADMESTRASQYNNRTVHFVDMVDYKSTQRAITQLAEMARISSDPIEIIFHSPGGDVFSGQALFDYIQMVKGSGIEVTTVALGGAFSMAAILLQAGTKRVMTPNSWMMIHEAGAGVWGKSSEMRDQSELMERLEVQATAHLAERSTLTVEEIRSRCHRKDWWLDAKEALQYGFIDEIRPEPAPTPISKPTRRRTTRKPA